MDFRPNILSFMTGTYVVTRRGPTLVGNDGRADVASSSTFSILAAVQPMNGRELQRLPEGMRSAERKTVYTATLLQAIGAPDVISIGDAEWEVEVIEDWSQGLYYKATVAKVGD